MLPVAEAPAGPTDRGRRHRDRYLGPDHTAALFARSGNIGPGVWWNGNIIGGWAQPPTAAPPGTSSTDPDGQARTAVAAEAARLTEFLDGARITRGFRTPLERQLAA
ncbi:crosslink repair DNA glycosylase YcaQ family protein [Streptomyces sp. NBC_01142]|uniref:DNA glycosylase AlkZ-like family protein n=1 Tax=Streptomyces sp. NBC_01142 TaxID=2975865 RepID=UPI00338F9E78